MFANQKLEVSMAMQATERTILIDGQPHTLKFLHPHQIVMIDEALAALDEFGEIRLVVEKSRLRFLVTQKSYDTLKWQPGSLSARDT